MFAGLSRALMRRVRAAGLALAVALLVPALLSAQTGTIVGSVIDAETGLSLAGVTVTIDGSSLGAVTNVDGVEETYPIQEGTCDHKTWRGSVCGRELPCRYHNGE